jgi:hypothetical protein
VQLCKGAIASGAAMLQKIAGVPDDKVAELMLAGGFGNYLSIRSALRIGLIPTLPEPRIRYSATGLLGHSCCSRRGARRADRSPAASSTSRSRPTDFRTSSWTA